MALTCPKCGDPHSLAEEEGTVPDQRPTEAVIRCGSCDARIEALSLPAVTPAPAAEGVPLGVGSGAACFFCEGKAATAVCQSCGRLICGRCQIDWAGATNCLTCVHANRELRDADEYRSRRVLYDNLALSLVLWPLVIPVYGVFGLVLTAPVALFLVIRYWNHSRGVVPRGRFRMVAAGVFATLALVAAGVGLAMLVSL